MGSGRGTRPTMRALRPPAAVPMRTLEGFSASGGDAASADVARGLREIQQAAKDATKAARQDARTRGRNLRVVFDPAASGSPPVATVTSLTVQHPLGRKPIGFERRSERTAVQFTIGSMTTKLVTFDSFVGSGTIDFWVF